MSTLTPRMSFIKPAGGDLTDETILGANYDKSDQSIGIQWVTDGSDPAVKFDGAIFKEITSKREYILRTAGGGTYIKHEHRAASLGPINHYTQQINGPINTVSPSGNWQSTAGTSKSWAVDRDAVALVRFDVEITAGAVTGIHFRIAGVPMSQTAVTYVTNGQKYGIRGTYLLDISGGGNLSLSLDVFNQVSATSVIQFLTWWVDTNAVLT